MARSITGTSISNKASRGAGAGCLIAFFSVFALFGLGFIGFAFAPPVLRSIGARSWPPVACMVTECFVETHRGDGTTYSVEIRYDYDVGGVTYHGDRYAFMDMSTSRRAAKQQIVDAHPVGSIRQCYVDPDDPAQAVIDRSLSGDMWFALIPLVFVAIGVGGVFFTVRGKLRPGTNTLPDVRAVLRETGAIFPQRDLVREGGDASDHTDGPLVLEPVMGRLGKVLFFLLFTLFWNGITSIFVTFAVRSHLRGRPEWFLTIFIIPFVLVGVGMLVATVYQFLATLNPKVRLTLETGRVCLGDTVALRWAVQGAVHRLRSLRIELVGQESATYRRGTDTHTDTHDFRTIPIVERGEDRDPVEAEGTSLLSIPRDTMHTFDAGNNEIKWIVRVKGDVPRWPDVSDEFKLHIHPADAGAPGEG